MNYTQQIINSPLQHKNSYKITKIQIQMDIKDHPQNKHTSQHSEPLCKQHTSKILDVYCQKDHKLICSTCLINSHQHHKLCPVATQAEKERNKLKDHFLKLCQHLKEYRSFDSHNQSQQIQLEHAFLDCQAEVNLFFQTIIEEVTRLRDKQIERLTSRKEQSIKKLISHREQLKQQINFLSEIQDMYTSLWQLGDGWFLLEQDKRNFIIDSSKSKKEKYVAPSLTFRKGGCLNQIAKSIQEMITLENNRNNPSIGMSPSLKKHKEPAVLQVNLREEYHRRKGTPSYNNPKPKPAKKTISILPGHDKANDSSLSLRKGNSLHEPKCEIPLRGNSAKQQKHLSSIQMLEQSNISLGDMSMTPLSSVQSFMRSSRRSETDSFLEDTTLKNTFAEFSMFGSEQCVYHLGGLSQTYSEKYHPETGNSERLSSSTFQFKGKGFHAAKVKTAKGEKCLILGAVSTNKNQSIQIYELSTKEQKIVRSGLKMAHARSSFGCAARQKQIYILGGKTHEKAVGTFQCYTLQENQLVYSKMVNMLQPRFDLGCCLGFDGHLYAIGGITSSNDSTNSTERFSFSKSAWESLKPMKRSRINFAVVATPRGIFAIGGHTTKRFLSQVQFFDYEEGRWIDKASLQTARCYHTAILSKDYQNITVFGGFSQNNTVLDSIQIYNIAKNEWNSGQKMRQKRCFHLSIQR